MNTTKYLALNVSQTYNYSVKQTYYVNISTVMFPFALHLGLYTDIALSELRQVSIATFRIFSLEFSSDNISHFGE